MHYLGTISGASGGFNNMSGPSGVQVALLSTKGLFYLVPSQSGIGFEFFGATGGTNTTAQRAAPLNAGLNGPFRAPPNGGVTDAGFVCGVYSSNGTVSVNVYWTPSQ